MNTKISTLALCTALLAGSVQAEVNLNGFASVVAGKTSSSDTLWGYDDKVDFKQGSLFGLQATSDLGEGLSATAQVLARGEDNWDAEFEWAYIAYDFNDEFRILAGRQRAPFYMYSDFLDVSYAYPWITPPAGVYALPFDTFDGVSGVYSFMLGDFDSSAQVIYGSNTDDAVIFGQNVESKFEDIFGGSLTLNRDWLTLRAGYFTSDTTLPADALTSLAQGWQNTPYDAIVSDIYVVEDKSSFVEFGFQVDYNNFLLIGEYTQLETENSPLADEKSMYLTAGYRFDDILVHFTYGYDEADIKNLVEGIPVGVDAGIDTLLASTKGLTDFQDEDATYYTLGMRWDFHESASFKVEYTDFSDDALNDSDAGLIRTALVTVF